jgi:hypothetical protein
VEDRYAGKPFLKLLEAYVLWCIDELTSEQAALLEKMTPDLQRAFKHEGSWHDIVSAQMNFGPGAAESVRENWRNNQQSFRTRGLPAPVPVEFARSFADALLRS